MAKESTKYEFFIIKNKKKRENISDEQKSHLHQRSKLREPQQQKSHAYLTDELYIRRRPTEWFRENIKVKRLRNVPAERTE